MKVRRSLRVAGWVMVTVGGLLVAFLAYQLVFTNVLSARSQKAAEPALQERYATAEIQVADTIPVSPPTTTTMPEQTTTTTQVVEAVRYEEPTPDAGTPFGELQMPSIGLDKVLFEGVDVATLKKGPGHMPWTPLPGQPGNAVISGHRTTYGAPFFDLDKVENGDQIIVTTALGKSVYEIRRTIIVAPTDVWVTEEMQGAWLTLTTCNPKYSARQRLVVQATLVEGPNFLYVETERQRRLQGAS